MAEPAMTADEIASCRKLYSQGEDPNFYFDGNPPLLDAVLENNYPKAKILIDAGANTCYKEHDEQSVLDHAIRQADLSMIQLLLENGASFILHDSFITAIDEKNVKIISELIKLGADVNTPNNKLTFPIMRAIFNRNFEIFKLLSEHGANLNITNSNGDTPLMLSTKMRSLPITKYLLQNKVDLNRKNKKNETALSIALGHDDFRTVQLLLESGANPDLASEAIQAKIKANPSFAAYMAKIQKTTSEKSQSDAHTGQETAMN